MAFGLNIALFVAVIEAVISIINAERCVTFGNEEFVNKCQG